MSGEELGKLKLGIWASLWATDGSLGGLVGQFG